MRCPHHQRAPPAARRRTPADEVLRTLPSAACTSRTRCSQGAGGARQAAGRHRGLAPSPPRCPVPAPVLACRAEASGPHLGPVTSCKAPRCCHQPCTAEACGRWDVHRTAVTNPVTPRRPGIRNTGQPCRQDGGRARDLQGLAVKRVGLYIDGDQRSRLVQRRCGILTQGMGRHRHIFALSLPRPWKCSSSRPLPVAQTADLAVAHRGTRA